MERNLFISSLFGGGAAGLSVDVSLYPLDTLKTRLQASAGFWKTGGFSGIYRGIGPVIAGSAPQSALFFCTYENFKHYVCPLVSSQYLPLVYMAAASTAEIVACLIRVPIEIVKQRRQASTRSITSWKVARLAFKYEGFKGFYRGFGTTVLRDVPFSFVQFPILEYLKSVYRIHLKNNITLEPWEVASCGSVSGAIAAAVSTPLDVIKTRVMLADKEAVRNGQTKFGKVFMAIYNERGIRGYFAGFVPRVTMIGIGGFIYFGAYDFSKKFCNDFILGGNYDIDV